MDWPSFWSQLKMGWADIIDSFTLHVISVVLKVCAALTGGAQVTWQRSPAELMFNIESCLRWNKEIRGSYVNNMRILVRGLTAAIKKCREKCEHVVGSVVHCLQWC